jgi:hypothetical protein
MEMRVTLAMRPELTRGPKKGQTLWV